MLRCDYLIVGAGLYGATLARAMTDAGKKCLVIDRRSHIGGNCYSEQRDAIDVHVYGPHIFHTNNEAVWNFVRRFTQFNNYRHRTIADYQGRLYSLPFSLQTLSEFYGHGTPQELLARLERDKTHFEHPSNMREHALNAVGSRIYETLIHGYTAKQWGREPERLPTSIIRRLPVRTNYCVDYFDDKFQGIPVEGYTRIVQRMLDGIEVELNIDYLKARGELDSLAERVVYTGPLDALYDYCSGRLEWRYIEFEHSRLESPNFQGTAIVTYPDPAVDWTRITEHKHFVTPAPGGDITWVTKEFARSSGAEPAYPIEDSRNRALHDQYRHRALADGFVVGGRLADYRYYDMHQVIAAALKTAVSELARDRTVPSSIAEFVGF
jgi:UDP-galactopyranose mutase